ncbi:MAG: nucleotidyltransferase domain-containing protein [Euryarchaeota archaeon]|nr:nucleotidyltransferase domain-containing protein [Euryarchaeota archaeon]
MKQNRAMDAQLKKLVSKAGKDSNVLAVIVYGSYVGGGEYRDIDVCLVLDPKAQVNAFEKRLEYSEHKNIDVNIFQTLPLYIQKRILREGIVTLCKDEDTLYDIAIKSVKEFELFKPKYELYLEGVANG